MVEIGWTGMKDQRPETRDWRRRIFFWFLLLSLVSSLQSQLYACPMCTELIESGKNAAQAWRFGKGIALSMIFMFGMPLLMIGLVVFQIVRAARRRQSAASSSHEPS